MCQESRIATTAEMFASANCVNRRFVLIGLDRRRGRVHRQVCVCDPFTTRAAVRGALFSYRVNIYSRNILTGSLNYSENAINTCMSGIGTEINFTIICQGLGK